MITRAKFKVRSIERSIANVIVGTDANGVKQWGNTEVHTVVMFPVVGNSPENDMFYASTPSGEIKLTTIHANLFELNGEYYVDFTKVG